jgi:hypothetical protein
MPGKGPLRAAVAIVAALTGMLIGAGDAGATTFCVPGFHSACPNGGGNVAQANLQTAMQTNGNDTVPDRIVIAAGTINTNSDSYELDSGDGDDLEIVGAGPDATAITNSGTGNEFMMDLLGGRDVTMRDLTLRVPASFPDNGGGALQAEQDTFVNVDFESRNPGSDGLRSAVGGSTFTDGRVYGSAGGSIDTAFAGNGAETGELRIERTTIENASWGILVDSIKVVTRVKRTKIIDPVAYGLRVTTGGFAVMENSLIVVDDALAVTGETESTETLIFTVRHSTIVDTGGADNPAIDVGDGFTPKAGTINAVIDNTIIAGNEEPLKCDSPMSSTSLTMKYSYFFHAASTNGNCSLPTIQTIDAFASKFGPPQFLGPGDYHLPVGSPAIDSGDPLVVTLPTEDLDGAPRPVDGDGDGDARRDMGAYEHQPPEPEGGGPGPNPPGSDVKAPQTTISAGPGRALAKGVARFRFRSSEAGSTFTCKLDRRKAARCKSPQTYKRLKPGRHLFKVWATDAAGNKDQTPAKRRFRVPSAA